MLDYSEYVAIRHIAGASWSKLEQILEKDNMLMIRLLATLSNSRRYAFKPARLLEA